MEERRAGSVPFRTQKPDLFINLAPQKRPTDRRIEKTNASLREALASLIREKDYDEISVTEILERANVGRSTFYMHFANKDELLKICMHDMLRSISAVPAPASGKRHENILRFSLAILEHVAEQQAQRGANSPSGRTVLHAHLQNVLAVMIADAARRELKAQRKMAGQASPDLLAKFVASTFVLVLDWWLQCENRMSPKEVDTVFRTLVLPTLASAC